jgi:hypothetical protein
MWDVAEYKTKLGREKEQEIVNLINQYQNSNIENKTNFLRKIVNILGINSTKEFLSAIKK